MKLTNPGFQHVSPPHQTTRMAVREATDDNMSYSGVPRTKACKKRSVESLSCPQVEMRQCHRIIVAAIVEEPHAPCGDLEHLGTPDAR